MSLEAPRWKNIQRSRRYEPGMEESTSFQVRKTSSIERLIEVKKQASNWELGIQLEDLEEVLQLQSHKSHKKLLKIKLEA